MRSFYVVCFLLLALFVKAQERPLLKKSNKTFDLKRDRSLQNQSSNVFSQQDSLFGTNSKKTISETRPITDYLIISQKRDTTFVDTTLTIEKEYKFNFRRKDDFEQLAFANSGQTVNSLSLQDVPKSTIPSLGFKAKNHQFFQSDEVYYYHVPTPLTEMYYKTTFSQGQSTDVLITANLSPRLNYAVAYRGHRSLGHYQHTLSGVRQFRFSTRYENSNQRYRLRFQMANQKIEQQENGGLDEASLIHFNNKTIEFEDRARLSVKFQNATNFFTGKRYLLEQDYAVLMTSDSIAVPALRLGHRVQTDSQRHTFEQSTPSAEFGEVNEELSAVKDLIHYTTTRHDLYAVFEQSKWGKAEAYSSAIDYRYSTVHTLDDPDVGESGFAIGGQLEFTIKDIVLSTKIEQAIESNSIGSFAEAEVSLPEVRGFQVRGGFRWDKYSPRLTLRQYHSGYASFVWVSNMHNTNRASLFSTLTAPKLGSFTAQFTTIDNYAYFRESEQGTLYAKPEQWGDQINVMKFRWDNRLIFGKFYVNTNLQFQQVDSSSAPLNIPDFIGRSSIAYADYWFDKAAYVHIGATLKHYSSFYADSYSPLISDFVLQNRVKIGGTPLLSAFFNAKIQQTRLYLNVDNLNGIFEGNNRLAAPDYPYRDFIVRFGIVWNFFK